MNHMMLNHMITSLLSRCMDFFVGLNRSTFFFSHKLAFILPVCKLRVYPRSSSG